MDKKGCPVQPLFFTNLSFWFKVDLSQLGYTLVIAESKAVGTNGCVTITL